ncbi:hypothetical protein KC926_01035 [Candidatus Kaiserbacteria bacterium]|nr:hypothetical protein [Candidatus Kaiserbacteria bacterium]
MQTENKSGWLNTKNLVFLLVGVMLMVWLVSVLVDSRFSELELATEVKISDQETLLVAIAETTARNGADQITESIVRDCSVDERESFDYLLSRLNDGLNHSQLVELERLFGRCGSFFAERKSVMVSRFTREIEVYEDYVDQLSLISGDDKFEDYKVSNWHELSDLEHKQSELFSKLVTLQDEIISNLLQGKSASSDEIVGILVEVSGVQESLLVARQQATTLRTDLLSL